MHRPLVVVALIVLAAGPAGAVTSALSRTFTPNRLIDFDALPLGALAAGTEIAPGVVFDGAYPPFVTGVAATVVDTGGGTRALDLASGQTAGFVFDPPVTAAGVSVEQIVAGSQVTVRALDGAGGVLTSYGYIYQVGVTVRFPEVTEATAPPITTFLVTAQGGAYRVDDLELLPEPASGSAALLALAALAARRRRR